MIADEYTYPKMQYFLASLHVRALIRLDNLDELDRKFDEYKQTGIYSASGKKAKFDYILKAVCNELMVTENGTLLEKYANKLQNWTAEQPQNSEYQQNMAYVASYLGEYEQAIEWLEKSRMTEDNPLELMESLSLLGVCYAQTGNTLQTESAIEAIHIIEYPHYSYGRQHYYQARIETALEKKKEAVNSLTKVERAGERYSKILFFEGDYFLKSLFGYPSFEKLMTPKG